MVWIVTSFDMTIIQTVSACWPPFSPSEAVPLSPAALHSGHSRPCAEPQAVGCSKAWEFGLSVSGVSLVVDLCSRGFRVLGQDHEHGAPNRGRNGSLRTENQEPQPA